MDPEKYIICNLANYHDVIAFQVTRVNSECYILSEAHTTDTLFHPIRQSIQYYEGKDPDMKKFPALHDPFQGYICYPRDGAVTIVHKFLGRLFSLDGSDVAKIFSKKIEVTGYENLELFKADHKEIYEKVCEAMRREFPPP